VTERSGGRGQERFSVGGGGPRHLVGRRFSVSGGGGGAVEVRV
jgi:hypothetical protein